MSSETDGIFSRRVLGCVIGISVVSIVVAFLMAAFGEDLGGTRSAGNDTFSYSALGHRAATELLRRSGVDVAIRRHLADTGFGPSVPLIVGEPPEGQLSPGDDEEDPLVETVFSAWLEDAPLVVFLPKWQGLPTTDGKFIRQVALRPRAGVIEILRRVGSSHEVTGVVVGRGRENVPTSCAGSWGGDYAIAIRHLQWIEPHPAVQPVVTCSRRTLIGHIQATNESPDVYIVSDPEILSNHGLGRGEHAALIVDLVQRHLEAEAVVFDETLHGFSRSANLLSEMLRFPMVVVVLHGLVLLGLIVWSGTGRFGKAAVATVRGVDNPRLLIDNAAQLLALGDHASLTMRQYYKQTLRAVGAHYFFAHDMPIDALQERLQAMTRSRGLKIDLQELRQRAQSVGSSGRSKERAVNVANGLHFWRMEMTDGIAADP